MPGQVSTELFIISMARQRLLIRSSMCSAGHRAASSLPEDEVESERQVILREIDMLAIQTPPQALFRTAFRRHLTASR